MEKHNRRRSVYDFGGKYDSEIVLLEFKDGRGKWQPAKVSRPSVYWFAFFRERGTFDLCSWGMCVYACSLEFGIKLRITKKSFWNYICKLRRLRKKWTAIKIGI